MRSKPRQDPRIAVRRPHLAAALSVAAVLLPVAGCDGGGSSGERNPGGGGGGGKTPGLVASREFRAIAGISMGAYGALNIGTKRPDLFGTIGALGGPVDLEQLLRDIVLESFEVKPLNGIPRRPGDDFTWDLLPPFPSRDTRVDFAKDLMLAFGNPVLHHPDPARRYLARDSEPAGLGQDDDFGPFLPPSHSRGFEDGGDGNQDGLRQQGEAPDELTDVILVATGSLPRIVPGVAGFPVGSRFLADLDADGVFDIGDGLVVNLTEPFFDFDRDLDFDAGVETFRDDGLDGVPGTLDFGEGNGIFDEDPDRATWRAENPTRRLATRDASAIASQRIYMDVGAADELEFARHYENLVAVLRAKGLAVEEEEGFIADCVTLPEPDAQLILVRYPGGHVGIPGEDDVLEDLLRADFCGPTAIWQRILSLLGYLNETFPNGAFGAHGTAVGDLVTREIASPALAAPGNPVVPRRTVVVYRPPAFFTTDASFPIVYFLGGYGQDPEDFERVALLLDLLILTGEVQNMYFAFVPGRSARRGTFYVNQSVPESQVPDVGPQDVTSGRYEDSLLQDLLPAIESGLLDGRVKR
jgi:hypothetical protein